MGRHGEDAHRIVGDVIDAYSAGDERSHAHRLAEQVTEHHLNRISNELIDRALAIVDAHACDSCRPATLLSAIRKLKRPEGKPL